jgi:hypothetical protein
VARRLGILLLFVLLAAGCGVRSSKPFTAAGTAGCLRSHGFTAVTTDPGQIGFIAAFADKGGIRGRSPSGNVLTIAFTADPSATGDTEDAFRRAATGTYKQHLSDVMQANRNAVLVWTTTPRSDELDTVNRCLKP